MTDKYLITVLPKNEVSDPQGEAILDSAHALGYPEIRSIRAGRSFLIETDGDPNRIAEISDKLLANPIVERFEVKAL
ncbi:MAG: phosphoribosylformylglycinamidine synthase subunit PurS [Candidatus Hydrogenedentota bacterium]